MRTLRKVVTLLVTWDGVHKWVEVSVRTTLPTLPTLLLTLVINKLVRLPISSFNPARTRLVVVFLSLRLPYQWMHIGISKAKIRESDVGEIINT